MRGVGGMVAVGGESVGLGAGSGGIYCMGV